MTTQPRHPTMNTMDTVASTDHLFPRYHVRPPSGYLNDPNGPIVHDGVFHLYYQCRLTMDQASPVLWGHATSGDLVHWDYHRPAITPHPFAGDRDGAWSGNTVLDDGQIRAFYSGQVAGEPLQRTLSAVSLDGGYTFAAPGEVIPTAEAGGLAELRDPFVWKVGDHWQMLLGASDGDGTAMIRGYNSPDLHAWTYTGALAQSRRTITALGDTGEMWECPQVVKAGDHLVAVFGAYARDAGIMKVYSLPIAHDPGGEYTHNATVDPASMRLVDHGPNFYAPSVLNDTPDGPLMWGWATEGRQSQWCEAAGWSGMLTLPRLVTRRADGSLASSPPSQLNQLRRGPRRVIVPGSAAEVGSQFEFGLTHDSQPTGTVQLRLDFGRGEHLEITVDYDGGCLSIDRNNASKDSRAHRGITEMAIGEPQAMDATADQAIRGFIDGSILELFLPDGQVATTRFYPTSAPPWRLSVQDAAETACTDVWEMV